MELVRPCYGLLHSLSRRSTRQRKASTHSLVFKYLLLLLTCTKERKKNVFQLIWRLPLLPSPGISSGLPRKPLWSGMANLSVHKVSIWTRSLCPNSHQYSMIMLPVTKRVQTLAKGPGILRTSSSVPTSSGVTKTHDCVPWDTNDWWTCIFELCYTCFMDCSNP